MGAAERYLDILAMNPLVVGGKNVIRIEADAAGKLWLSTKGAALTPLFPDPVPVVTTAGVLAFPGLATIQGLQAWFKADSIADVVFGTWPAIATVNDLSGLGSRTLTAVNSPTFVANSINGRPGFSQIAASSQFFRNTATNLITVDRGPRTVFFVGKPRDVNGGMQVAFRTDVAGNCYECDYLLSGGFYLVHSSGGADNQNITGVGGVQVAPAAVGAGAIFEHSYDGRFSVGGTDSLVRFRVNGSDYGVNGAAFSVAESGTTGFSVGASNRSPTQGWNGEWSECLIFGRELTPYERNLVQAYLAAKYAIVCAAPKLTTMFFGDSEWYGTGDATTIAAGGGRQQICATHPNISATVGTFTTPKGVDGNFNRCEGNAGFQSGPTGANAIGGQYAETLLAANIADLYMIMVGKNDDSIPWTAAQTGANIRALVDTIYARSPTSKVVVIRSNNSRSDQASRNALIAQQGPQIESALNGAINVLRNPALATSSLAGGGCIIPATTPDALFAASGGDPQHLSVAGWAKVLAPGGTVTGLGLDAELRVRGL